MRAGHEKLWRARLRNAIAERSRRWARRRQGLDPARLTLAGDRIYILPTASGLLYAAMVATMLAGAMNYNNNLAFALAFLLAGIGIVAIYHTHRTLAGLRLDYLGATPVFAGDPLDVRFALANDSPAPREEILLDWREAPPLPGGVPALGTRTVSLALPTARRGPLELPPLRLATRAPLGLTRAWVWVHLGERPVVYPRPAARACELPRVASTRPDRTGEQGGEDDFAGLRDYRPGDSPRWVAWKNYARSGELLVREYRGGAGAEPAWIDWDDVAAPDTETRISLLARLVIDAHDAGRSWGLRVPGTELGPASGRGHLHRCLACLATTGLPAGGCAA